MLRRAKLPVSVACLAVVAIGLLVSFNMLQASRQSSSAQRAGAYPVRFEMPSPTKVLWAPSLDVPQPAPPASLAPAEVIEAPAGSERAKVVSKPDIMPGLIPVSFRLGDSAEGRSVAPDQVIQASMPVVYNRGSIGLVAIWIDPKGAITIDSGQLSRALASANRPLSEAIVNSGQERVSFSSLRSRGMTINYDPIANQIVMAYRS